MKKAWNITWRVVLAAMLTVYVCVALLNYSVVQSVIGGEVGRRLSAEWGGEVKIGSLHANPFNHLIANNLLMIAPDGDTILDAETLRVHFKRFPFRNNRLAMSRVYLKNAYYHLAIYSIDDPNAPDFVRNKPYDGRETGLNLQYILNHYYKGPRDWKDLQFTVDVDEVVLDHVHYKMDLPERHEQHYDYGVSIPHMEFYDIRSKISKIHVVNDDVTCRLVRFSTEERSGFKVNDIAAQVHVSGNDITVKNFKVETDRSVIKADVEMLYDGWLGMVDYLHGVRHRIDLHEGTSVALADIAYWAPALWNIDMQMIPVGGVTGTVDSMHTDNMSLRFGNASEVAINGDITGLSDPANMELDLDNLALRFEQSDLRQICAMMPKYITPEIERRLNELEYIDLNAQARGGWHKEATANVNLVCGLGNLRADATMTPKSGGRRVVLHADSDGMGLTPLGSDWQTHSGFTLDVDADMPNNIRNLRAIEAEASAYLTGSVVKGNNIDPVYLHAYMNDGKLEFAASCDDSLLYADLYGTAKLTDSERVYSAHVDLYRFQADTFGLVKPAYGRIATHLDANFKGNSLDALRGAMTASGTSVGQMKLHELTLSVTPDYEQHKSLRLESDALTATVGGRFAYADLPVMLQHFCYEILPEDLGLVAEPDSAALTVIADNTMNFHLRIVDSTLLTQVLPTLSLANGTRIDGTYNGNDLLRLVARCDAARIGSVAINNIGLSSLNQNGIYYVDIESSNIKVGEGLELMNDITLELASNQNQADLRINWGDQTQSSHGDLLLDLNQGNINVLKPYFYIDNNQWRIDIDSLHLETHPCRQRNSTRERRTAHRRPPAPLTAGERLCGTRFLQLQPHSCLQPPPAGVAH